MFRALIVAAVSSSQQATEDKASLPEQVAGGEAMCEARGWNVVGRIVIPGHSRNYMWLHEICGDCPEYAEMVRVIESGAVDVVVVRDFDRLWRTAALQSQVCALCEQHGVQIYSINQPREPIAPEKLSQGDDTNLIIHGLSGIVAQMENRQRSRRRMIGLKARIERGLGIFGDGVPYGYRRVPDSDVLQVNEREAQWVRYLFEGITSGRGAYTLARELDEMGVPVPAAYYADRMARRTNPGWCITTVFKILHREFYCGTVSWGKWSNPNGAHIPLVSRDMWERAQASIKSRVARSLPKRLLSGLFRCGYCGHAMTFQTARDGYTYVRCAFYVRSRGRSCQCNAHSYLRLHSYVLEQVQAAIRDPDVFLAARRTEHQIEAVKADLDGIEAEISAQRAALERWDAVYERNGIDIDRYLDHTKRLESSIVALEARAEQLRPSLRSEEPVAHYLSELSAYADTLTTLDDAALREVLVHLLRGIYLRRDAPPSLIWW
jgi:site-specific DNA recombinase